MLRVGGLDLLNGTPVYDIKPYLAYAESVPEAKSGFAGPDIERLEVIVEESAAESFAELPDRAQAVIKEALSLDPRPAVQSEETGRVYGASLCEHEVRFIVGDDACRIVEIN